MGGPLASYLFSSRSLTPFAAPPDIEFYTRDEAVLSLRFMTAVANFAKYG